MRRPVQIQGRGGAAAGSVNNRAQYLRPALDNQNSRMLARAFSQMNRSFGRIASNETRLQNRQMADELQEAEQQELENKERAGQLGYLASQTGEEYLDLFMNTPASLQYYNERRMVGEVDESITKFTLELQTSDDYGNPDTPGSAARRWADFSAGIIESTPMEFQGEVAARLSTAAVSSISESDVAAADRALVKETNALQQTFTKAIITSDSAMEMMSEMVASREEQVGARMPARGNKMSSDALVNAIQMVPHLENLAVSANAVAKLREALDFVDPETGKNSWLLTYGGEDQIRIVAAIESAERDVAAKEQIVAAQAEAAKEQALQGLMLQMAKNANNPAPLLGQFLKLYPDNTADGLKAYNNAVDTIIGLEDTQFLTATPTNDARSAAALSIHKLTLDESSMTAEERIAFYQAVAPELTRSDYNKLTAYQPKHPEALQDPVLRTAIAAIPALQTTLSNMYKASSRSGLLYNTDSGIDQPSELGQQYRAFLNTYIQDRPEEWSNAVKNGTRDVFIDKAITAATEYILDYDLNTDDPTSPTYAPETLRGSFEKALSRPDFIVRFGNDPVFQQFFAGTNTATAMQDAMESIRESASANIAATQAKLNTTTLTPETEDLFGPMREGLADDDGDGIANARDRLLTISPEEIDVIPAELPQVANLANASDAEATATARTPMEFAQGYLGVSEDRDYEVLSSFIRKAIPDFDDPRNTAWCAGFVNGILNEAGKEGNSSLRARSFLDWSGGTEVDTPTDGDIVVFWRESPESAKGHVGFFAGYDDSGDILVLGGNQDNTVSIKSYPKERLLGIRRPN